MNGNTNTHSVYGNGDSKKPSENAPFLQLRAISILQEGIDLIKDHGALPIGFQPHIDIAQRLLSKSQSASNNPKKYIDEAYYLYRYASTHLNSSPENSTLSKRAENIRSQANFLLRCDPHFTTFDDYSLSDISDDNTSKSAGLMATGVNDLLLSMSSFSNMIKDPYTLSCYGLLIREAKRLKSLTYGLLDPQPNPDCSMEAINGGTVEAQVDHDSCRKGREFLKRQKVFMTHFRPLIKAESPGRRKPRPFNDLLKEANIAMEAHGLKSVERQSAKRYVCHKDEDWYADKMKWQKENR